MLQVVNLGSEGGLDVTDFIGNHIALLLLQLADPFQQLFFPRPVYFYDPLWFSLPQLFRRRPQICHHLLQLFDPTLVYFLLSIKLLCVLLLQRSDHREEFLSGIGVESGGSCSQGYGGFCEAAATACVSGVGRRQVDIGRVRPLGLYN